MRRQIGGGGGSTRKTSPPTQWIKPHSFFSKMDCLNCGTTLIHGGDHDFEDYGAEGDGIVSNLSCPECGAFVLFYSEDPVEKKEE